MAAKMYKPLGVKKVSTSNPLRGLTQSVWFMMTSSNRNIFRVTGLCAGNSLVTGEFSSQRPVTRSFDIFFDLRLNERLSKRYRRWWFGTLSRSFWRHGNVWMYLFQNQPHPNALRQPWPHVTIMATAHYDDVIMGAIVSLITSLRIVYSTVYSDADQRKHQSSVSLAFVWGIHRGPVISPRKWPVTRKMIPFDDVIMNDFQPQCTRCRSLGINH